MVISLEVKRLKLLSWLFDLSFFSEQLLLLLHFRLLEGDCPLLN